MVSIRGLDMRLKMFMAEVDRESVGACTLKFDSVLTEWMETRRVLWVWLLEM
jgi:hypothetical protein